MVSEYLLKSVMLIELGLLVLAVGVFFMHGLWLLLTQKRALRQMETARDSLAKLLTRGTVSVEEIDVLRQLPRDVQVMAFLEISRNVSGAGKERLRFVAGEVSLIERARKLCERDRKSTRLNSSHPQLSRMPYH